MEMGILPLLRFPKNGRERCFGWLLRMIGTRQNFIAKFVELSENPRAEGVGDQNVREYILLLLKNIRLTGGMEEPVLDFFLNFSPDLTRMPP